MCYTSASLLVGERFFSAAAYGLPALGHGLSEERANRFGFTLDELTRAHASVPYWLDAVVNELLPLGPRIVGCTTTFEQTAASISLLKALKAADDEIIRVIGGANCDGDMAYGVLDIGHDVIDHVFSGESEATFCKFLQLVRDGERPRERVIVGAPCRDLERLPTPRFDEYFQQLDAHLGGSEYAEVNRLWLTYEASRGCWWGEKHHCTFCGINGDTGMIFREKSAERVLSDLRDYRSRYAVRNVCMLDNIMPHRFFTSVLPILASAMNDFHIFYEQKANIPLARVKLLKAAGVDLIQPGIEALSTPFLKAMDKGVSAIQNINLLRYSRAVGVSVNWNLLWGFPSDRIQWYIDTLELLPLIRHLHPPSGLCALSIERFSPYFDRPERYGVANIRPVGSYAEALPPSGRIDKVAYHFIADYESESRSRIDIVESLGREVALWRRMWGCVERPTSATADNEVEAADSVAPCLGISDLGDGNFLLLDTRGLEGASTVQFVSESQARVALVRDISHSDADLEWAIRSRVVARVDSELIPLATASADLLATLEADAVTSSKPAHLTTRFQSATLRVAD